MKLSAYMKTEIEYVNDKYLLEAIDTDRDVRSAPMYIVSAGQSSPVDRLKNVLSVAACVVLVAAIMIAFILMRNSISIPGDDPLDSVTDTGTETEQDLADKEKETLKQKLLSIYEPSSEGAVIINDNVVYRDMMCYGDYVFSVTDEVKNADHESLYLRNMKDTDSMTIACTAPDCDHDDIFCPAVIPADCRDYHLYIMPEGKDKPVLYLIGEMKKTLSCSGVSVSISDLDLNTPNSESNVIFEYDFETNTRRTVAVRVPFYALNEKSFYYDGKLYVTEEIEHRTYDAKTGVMLQEFREEAFYVDVATGEWERFECEDGVGICGVYEGKIYLLTTKGDVIKCAPDFSGAEIVANVGKSSKDDFDGLKMDFIQSAVIEDGILYYCRNEKRENIFMTDDSGESINREIFSGDLYALDLTEEDGKPDLVDDDVILYFLIAYNGCLYYKTLDSKLYGFYSAETLKDPIFTTNGGSLYKYDPETAEATVLFSDCGGDLESIYEITEDSVIFAGIYYKGLGEGYEYKGADCRSYMKYNYVKDELTVIGDIK